jgi:hypothetical protein
MTGSSSIKAGMFMQKSFKSGGRDCWGRTPSGFPLLQSLEFGRHAGGNESGDCLGLAQFIDLPPRLETENDRSGSLLRQGRFVVLQKEPFECRGGHGLRRGARSLPLLEGAKLYWQAACHKRTDGLRLTETAGRTPCFQLYDHRVERLTGHERKLIMPIPRHSSNW